MAQRIPYHAQRLRPGCRGGDSANSRHKSNVYGECLIIGANLTIREKRLMTKTAVENEQAERVVELQHSPDASLLKRARFDGCRR